MTWDELNTMTDDMLPDMLGASWYDLIEETGDEEELWSCQALDMVIEVLGEFDFPANHEAEYLDNQRLIKILKAVR